MRKLLLLTACVIAPALSIAACGGSSSSSSSSTAASSSSASATSSASASTSASTAGELTIAAQPSGALAYTKKTLTAKAGTVRIAFTNKSPLAHNLTIQKGTGPTGPILGATPTFDGGTKVLTVHLAAGKYTFYCSVPGHRMAGMQGILTVT